MSGITYVGAWQSKGQTMIEVWNNGEKTILPTQTMSQKDQEKLRSILNAKKET